MDIHGFVFFTRVYPFYLFNPCSIWQHSSVKTRSIRLIRVLYYT